MESHESKLPPSTQTAHPNTYACPRTITTPRLDGKLDEAIWGHAPWTDLFVDIEGDRKPLPHCQTRARMMWDDDCLYIGCRLEEPHVWGTLTEHDCVIYQDNDFEVFLDPDATGHHYVELEVNALNTTWDLMLNRPYRSGGKAISGWEFRGLRTAVHVDGTLNDPTDQDTGWSVEVAIPWEGLREVTKQPLPPRDGDQWRINFSRVQWQVTIGPDGYAKVPNTPEYNWVWSPQGVIDMHRPEHWGVLQFSTATTGLPAVRPLDEWDNRLALIKVWEAQTLHRRRNGRYAASVADLNLDLPATIEATTNTFDATIGSHRTNHELRFDTV